MPMVKVNMGCKVTVVETCSYDVAAHETGLSFVKAYPDRK